jgi:hypothetical protein
MIPDVYAIWYDNIRILIRDRQIMPLSFAACRLVS